MNAPTPTPIKPATPIAKAPLTPSAGPAVKPSAPPPFTLGQASNVGPYLKLLVYGKPGVGKTELIASSVDVPEMGDVLYVDVESGEQTVHDNPRIANWEALVANRVPCNTFKQVSQIHDWLKGHIVWRDKNDSAAEKILRDQEARLRGCSPDQIERPQRFRTVILDSLTEINAYSNYELLGVEEAKVLAGNADEVEVATWDEFRKNNQRIQMLLRAFKNLPINLLVAAHEQYKQDEVKKFHYEPAVTGQLARQVQGFFDIVGHFQMAKVGEKMERRLYVQPAGPFDAKNRRSVFRDDYFKEADLHMTKIMRLIGLTK
jgi:hypothetical protein